MPVSKHPIVHRSLSVFKAGQKAQSETKMFLPLICSLWLFATSSSGIEYSNNLLCKDKNYEVHWRFENNTETFYFKVRANATGWIGFGVSRLLWPENETLRWNMYSMRHYDVLVGGVDDSGKTYFKVSFYVRLFLSSQCPSPCFIDTRKSTAISTVSARTISLLNILANHFCSVTCL